jgi:predicted NBD/HSP70 family sugar kinase
VNRLLSDPSVKSPKALEDLPGDTARTILRIVRASQPISRIELARRLDLNRSTITEIVKPLILSGVLCEVAPAQAGGRVGRPPIGLSLSARDSFFIGVNIGVRRSQVGAATADGRVLHEETFETSPKAVDTVANIRSLIERLRGALPERALASVGVSVPGPIDAERKRLLLAPHLGWNDVNIADALRFAGRQSGNLWGAVPVVVENDANAAAMYEARRRLRERTSAVKNDFVLVRAGTGIGVGLVLGGNIYRGSGTDSGLLGEFGHMTIVAGGKPCVCGNRGCWERYASAASASSLYAGERVQIRGEKPPRFVEIVGRAEAGELRARATLERIGEYMGIGISNVISGLGISRVIVSGRIVLGWKFIKEPLYHALGSTMAGRLANWTVEAGEPTGAGLGGGLEIAFEQYLAMVTTQSRVAA